MFEQSLYEQKPVATPNEESDLFKNYEIKSWNRSKRLYRILGISAIGNIVAILIVAQTSLLTMKGCDSPLVGRVCQVLDTVYVGTMLFGTDREYVDEAYDNIDIADSEITFVDVSGETPPLSYPEGYFQVANPMQYQAMLDQQAGDPMFNSGFPSGFPTSPSTGGSLIDTPPVMPPANPNVIDGQLPSFGNDTVSSYTPPKPRKGSRGGRVTTTLPDVDDNAPDGSSVAIKKPSPTPTADIPPTPASTPLSTEAIKAVEINKKPLVDLADDVATKWDAKEVDLDEEFMIVLNGVLAADGTLDTEKSKFDVAKQKGDPKMIDVGKAAFEALGKSGYLSYLKLLGVDKINATLVQDDKEIKVVITSGQKTPELAKTVASGINSSIAIGKVVTQDPSDERTLLNGAKVTAEGKNFILNFVIPKPIAQEMINRKLKEAQAKKATQPKPNGTIGEKGAVNTAVN